MTYSPESVNRALRRRIGAALGLALILAYVLSVLLRHHVSIGRASDDLEAIALDWLLVLALVIIAVALEQHSLRRFGLRTPHWRDGLAMGVTLLVTAGLTVLLMQIPAVSAPLRHLTLPGVASVPFGVRLALVLTAAACEEFIFRGFLIEELGDWSGSVPLAAGVSLALFVLPHAWLYGFTLALTVPAMLGGGLTLLYLWRRNLPVCMLMHAIIDGLPLLLVPLLNHPHGG